MTEDEIVVIKNFLAKCQKRSRAKRASGGVEVHLGIHDFDVLLALASAAVSAMEERRKK